MPGRAAAAPLGPQRIKLTEAMISNKAHRLDIKKFNFGQAPVRGFISVEGGQAVAVQFRYLPSRLGTFAYFNDLHAYSDFFRTNNLSANDVLDLVQRPNADSITVDATIITRAPVQAPPVAAPSPAPAAQLPASTKRAAEDDAESPRERKKARGPTSDEHAPPARQGRKARAAPRAKAAAAAENAADAAVLSQSQLGKRQAEELFLTAPTQGARQSGRLANKRLRALAQASTDLEEDGQQAHQPAAGLMGLLTDKGLLALAQASADREEDAAAGLMGLLAVAGNAAAAPASPRSPVPTFDALQGAEIAPSAPRPPADRVATALFATDNGTTAPSSASAAPQGPNNPTLGDLLSPSPAAPFFTQGSHPSQGATRTAVHNDCNDNSTGPERPHNARKPQKPKAAAAAKKKKKNPNTARFSRKAAKLAERQAVLEGVGLEDAEVAKKMAEEARLEEYQRASARESTRLEREAAAQAAEALRARVDGAGGAGYGSEQQGGLRASRRLKAAQAATGGAAAQPAHILSAAAPSQLKEKQPGANQEERPAPATSTAQRTNRRKRARCLVERAPLEDEPAVVSPGKRQRLNDNRWAV